MQISARLADVLFFRCGPCGAELSVPFALQGIDGPCPRCGQLIKAPAFNAPAVPQMVEPPPLDLSQDKADIPVMSTHSLAWGKNHPTGRDLSVNQKLPDPIPSPPKDFGERGSSSRFLPRHWVRRPAQSFQAKLVSVSPEEVPDVAGQMRDALTNRWKSAPKNGTGGRRAFFDSPLFLIRRVALWVTIGGLFAGLGLYLKYRNLVLDFLWRPAPMETVVEVPLTGPSGTPRPPELEKPFLGEDPSELNGIFDHAALAPLPEVTAIAVGAAPIAGSKN
jgi:hypothetical protein